MDQKQILKNLLDFTTEENSVFLFLLLNGRAKTALIAKNTKLARSTVNDILQRLKKRRLIRVVEMGKRREWKVTNTIRLVENFLSMAEFLQVANKNELPADKKVQLRMSRETEFKIYVGRYNILRIYKHKFKEYSNTRVYGLQSNSSAQACIKKLGTDKLAYLNNIIKEEKVILESIISEEPFVDHKDILSNREYMESFKGRITSTKKVPDEFLKFNAELIIFKNELLLTNWGDEALIVIKNSDIIAMIKVFFKLLNRIGRKIDFTEHINKLAQE